MKKWKGLKGWQKGGVIGFSIIGLTHILFVTLILLIDGAKGVTGLVFFIIEFPLFILHSHIFDLLFKNEYYPQLNSTIFWLWIYLCGTIAWGVVGAIAGIVLGFLSDLSKAQEGEKEKAS